MNNKHAAVTAVTFNGTLSLGLYEFLERVVKLPFVRMFPSYHCDQI